MRLSLLTLTLALAACGPTTTSKSGDKTPTPTSTSNDPGWHCFELSWTDAETQQAKHNSVCVRSDDLCTDDVNSMRKSFSEATYNGCFHQQEVHCYSPGGDRPLCFVNASDCQNSRTSIGGGECTVGVPTAAATTAVAPPTAPVEEGGWHCFGVGWMDDQTGQPMHNSECVRDKDHCEKDLNEMRGYFAEGQYTNGCFHLATSYCFKSESMSRALCYQDEADCKRGLVTMDMEELTCVPSN